MSFRPFSFACGVTCQKLCWVIENKFIQGVNLTKKIRNFKKENYSTSMLFWPFFCCTRGRREESSDIMDPFMGIAARLWGKGSGREERRWEMVASVLSIVTNGCGVAGIIWWLLVNGQRLLIQVYLVMSPDFPSTY